MKTWFLTAEKSEAPDLYIQVLGRYLNNVEAD